MEDEAARHARAVGAAPVVAPITFDIRKPVDVARQALLRVMRLIREAPMLSGAAIHHLLHETGARCGRTRRRVHDEAAPVIHEVKVRAVHRDTPPVLMRHGRVVLINQGRTGGCGQCRPGEAFSRAAIAQAIGVRADIEQHLILTEFGVERAGIEHRSGAIHRHRQTGRTIDHLVEAVVVVLELLRRRCRSNHILAKHIPRSAIGREEAQLTHRAGGWIVKR